MPRKDRLDIAEIVLMISGLIGILYELRGFVRLFAAAIMGTLIALAVAAGLKKKFGISGRNLLIIYYVMAIILLCLLSYAFYNGQY
jgi:predicted PurR-regulated permease PerM